MLTLQSPRARCSKCENPAHGDAPCPPPLRAEERRTLGKERVRSALRLISQARDSLCEATGILGSIDGMIPPWEEIGKLADQVKAGWHVVDEMRVQLQDQGGPLVSLEWLEMHDANRKGTTGL